MNFKFQMYWLIGLMVVMGCSGSILAQRAHAQSTGASTQIQAQVGEFNLNLSGYQSPYASIVLTSYDGTTVLRSAVADAQGNFSFTDVLIRQGFSGFCLVATDFKNLGNSTSCFSITPASADVTMDNIFLPPTLGLSRTDIAFGTAGEAFGYTMPGATVTLHISNGTTFTAIADQTGYYDISIVNLPVGDYDIYATAVYQSNPSVSPSKTVQIHILSFTQRVGGGIGDFLKKIWNLLTSILRNPWLWIFVLLVVTTYLVYKHWPEKFHMFSKYFVRKEHDAKLHDWWWVGY